MRKHSVVVRLLHGEPGAEDAARAHGPAHEERHGGGQVLGRAPKSAQSQLHGPVQPSAARDRRKTVHRLQRHIVVLHQRRPRGQHKAVGVAEAVLHHVQPGVLRKPGRSAVSIRATMNTFSGRIYLQTHYIFFFFFLWGRNNFINQYKTRSILMCYTVFLFENKYVAECISNIILQQSAIRL